MYAYHFFTLHMIYKGSSMYVTGLTLLEKPNVDVLFVIYETVVLIATIPDGFSYFFFITWYINVIF